MQIVNIEYVDGRVSTGLHVTPMRLKELAQDTSVLAIATPTCPSVPRPTVYKRPYDAHSNPVACKIVPRHYPHSQRLFDRYYVQIVSALADTLEDGRCWDPLDVEDCEQPMEGYYLGSRVALYPSGKIYAPWTTNQTSRDEIRDHAFHDALEEFAMEHDCSVYEFSGDLWLVRECEIPEDAHVYTVLECLAYFLETGDPSQLTHDEEQAALDLETRVQKELGCAYAGTIWPGSRDEFGQCDVLGLRGATVRYVFYPANK